MSSIDRGLLVRDGSRAFVLPVDPVVESCRPLPVTPTPGMPHCALGVSIVRGLPLPVVDLAKLLGAQARPPGRFVTLRLGDRRAVLAVEEVVGLVDLARLGFAELPPLLREVGSELVARLAALDGELVAVLEAARLVPESIWASLPAGADRT